MEPKKESTELVKAGAAGGLAPVPRSIEEEDKLARFAAEENLARMAIIDPDKVEKAMNALARVLKTMRGIAIEDTVGIDWTLFKDREGKEVAVPRDSGCVKMRKWLGITIKNHRHDDGTGKEGPRVWTDTVDEGNGKTKAVQVVSGFADGECSRTGEIVTAIYFAVRNEPQEFTGRKHPTTKLSNLTDLYSSWRTGIDSKITRILSGARKIPIEELKERKIDTSKCYRGHGYGTGADRAAGAVAEQGVTEKIEMLRREVTQRIGGKMELGRPLVKRITSSPKTARSKGFAGYDSLDQLTKDWQIQKAWENLVNHPQFGNKALKMPDEAAIAPWDRPKAEEPPPPEEEDMGDPMKPTPEELEPGSNG